MRQILRVISKGKKVDTKPNFREQVPGMAAENKKKQRTKQWNTQKTTRDLDNAFQKTPIMTRRLQEKYKETKKRTRRLIDNAEKIQITFLENSDNDEKTTRKEQGD